MDLFETIARRRSIRRYRPDPVSDELITQVLDAARLAPSGSNAQPWKFVVVRSEEKRAALCEAAYGQPMFRQAPVVIVALGDRKVFRKWLRRGKELVDIGAVDPQVMQTVGEVYRARGKEPGAADRGILANCMIAIDHLTL
ncbi:MAG TPA: nitroreductase family protein, partial [Thermoguttaceae bacterium]|nr:nitroreductase family protein [Thermoguttaceae bacterium]